MDNETGFNRKYTEEEIEVKHAFSHNVFVKLHTMKKAGVQYKGHYHNMDHTTLVSSGKVKVEFGAVPEAGLEEEIREYIAPAMYVTRAYRRHKITALEDNTVFSCIHAVRDDNNDPITHITDDAEDHTEFLPKTKNLKSHILNRPGPGMGDITLVYPIDPIQYNELLQRADQEGTLEPGSQDQLI